MTQHLPSHLEQALHQALRLEQERPLWPGWMPRHTPLALYESDRAYLVGHPAPPPDYSPIASSLDRPIWAGPPLAEMVANTASMVAGCLSAVVSVPPPDRMDAEALARLILHEAFHVHQAEALTALLGVDAAAMGSMACYPEGDPENNALAMVENRLLIAALEGDAAALPRFLAVRQHRHQRLAAVGLPEIPEYEQRVEYTEGTPTYVELQAGWPVAELMARLSECSVGGKWAAYRRFYFTGAAQALCLDRLLPGWQERLEGGASLQSLLALAVGERPPVEGVLDDLGFPAILAEEEERQAAAREQVRSLLAEIAVGPGVRVEILLPPGANGLTWDPTSLLNVSPGVRLHTRMCGVTGNGLRVMVHRLCLEEQEEGRRRLTLRLPGEPTLGKGSGFRLTADGLSIEAQVGSMDQASPGVLRVHLQQTLSELE